MGWISSSSGHSDRLSVHISAIVRHFRPLSPVFGAIDAAQLRLVNAEEVVDGTRCMLLEERLPGNGNVRRYWVSPEQGMAIVRYVSCVEAV